MQQNGSKECRGQAVLETRETSQEEHKRHLLRAHSVRVGLEENREESLSNNRFRDDTLPFRALTSATIARSVLPTFLLLSRHNTNNMTGARPCEMVPDHDNSDPQQPLSGEMQSDYQVSASSLLLSLFTRMCPSFLMLQQHNRSNQCDCCFETVNSKKTIQLPGCGHAYCADCLRVMYRMAINNEAHFPPSCCSGAINIDSVKHLLHRPQVKSFERCAAEYGTPELDRRYCADTRCSSFLGRANGGILRCSKCGKLTCDSCRDYAHPGACKEERGRDVYKLDADLERLAVAEGWQRCPSCSRLVALAEGCNHITLVSP